MTQYQNVTIDPTVTNGSQLASNINSWREATLSLHSGVARPAYATAGTMWISTASTPWKLYVFDGVNDAPLGEIDPAGHAFVSAGGTDFTNDLMTAADSAAARDKLGAQKKIGYEPVDKAGDTATGTIESRMALGDPETGVRSIGNRVVLEGRGDVDGDNYRGWLEVEEEVGVGARMKIVLIGDDGRKEFLFDQSGRLETPGPLVLPAAPTADLHAATKKYVDDAEAAAVETGLGVGQTWQEMKDERTPGTVYQNTGDKPIMVYIFGSSTGYAYASVSSDGVTYEAIGGGLSSENGKRAYFIVPVGHYYRAGAVNSWLELR
ncbi:hypothetical protein [uncultured Martelella sp.]|uniref:hypothetical protein n=1 Tax=uncultured Martelella sp. TaxID=392331 RepID=UPI0029C765BE|nr:hypothetical protein [uncultured Martelella sp.]